MAANVTPVNRDPLKEECERLREILYKGPSPAVHARWQALWQEYLSGEKFRTSPLLCALPLCLLGWWVYMSEENFADAVDCLRQLFMHPQIEQMDALDRIFLQSNWICSLLSIGDEVQAITLARSLLRDTPDSERRVALYSLGILLDGLFMNQDPQDFASEEMTTLVWDITQGLRRRPLIRRRLPEQASYEQLMRLNSKNVPVQERDNRARGG